MGPYYQNKKIYTGRYNKKLYYDEELSIHFTKKADEKETLIWDVKSMTEFKKDCGEVNDLSWTLRVQRQKDSIHRYVDAMEVVKAARDAITLATPEDEKKAVTDAIEL